MVLWPILSINIVIYWSPSIWQTWNHILNQVPRKPDENFIQINLAWVESLQLFSKPRSWTGPNPNSSPANLLQLWDLSRRLENRFLTTRSKNKFQISSCKYRQSHVQLLSMSWKALASNGTYSFYLLKEFLKVLRYVSGANIFLMSEMTFPILMMSTNFDL